MAYNGYTWRLYSKAGIISCHAKIIIVCAHNKSGTLYGVMVAVAVLWSNFDQHWGQSIVIYISPKLLSHEQESIYNIFRKHAGELIFPSYNTHDATKFWGLMAPHSISEHEKLQKFPGGALPPDPLHTFWFGYNRILLLCMCPDVECSRLYALLLQTASLIKLTSLRLRPFFLKLFQQSFPVSFKKTAFLYCTENIHRKLSTQYSLNCICLMPLPGKAYFVPKIA